MTDAGRGETPSVVLRAGTRAMCFSSEEIAGRPRVGLEEMTGLLVAPVEEDAFGVEGISHAVRDGHMHVFANFGEMVQHLREHHGG